MSGFPAEWLALREPLDACSRSAALAARLRTGAPSRMRRIVDLATGTAANLRYLAPRLGGEQDWLLVDNDERLLEAAGGCLRAWQQQRGLTLHERGESLILNGRGFRCRVRRLQLDLVDGVRCLDLDGQWLVTASALLDLVSKQWLDGLLARCRAAGTWLLFVLSYDGTVSFWPALAEDGSIQALVNRHQTRDKGFGPALGPRAAWHAPDMSRRHGYRVAEASTPWRIGAAQLTLQRAMIEGCASAALEMEADQVDRIKTWRRQREDHIAAGNSRLRVGHRDLLAWPVAEEKC